MESDVEKAGPHGLFLHCGCGMGGSGLQPVPLPSRTGRHMETQCQWLKTFQEQSKNLFRHPAYCNLAWQWKRLQYKRKQLHSSTMHNVNTQTPNASTPSNPMTPPPKNTTVQTEFYKLTDSLQSACVSEEQANAGYYGVQVALSWHEHRRLCEHKKKRESKARSRIIIPLVHFWNSESNRSHQVQDIIKQIPFGVSKRLPEQSADWVLAYCCWKCLPTDTGHDSWHAADCFNWSSAQWVVCFWNVMETLLIHMHAEMTHYKNNTCQHCTSRATDSITFFY